MIWIIGFEIGFGQNWIWSTRPDSKPVFAEKCGFGF